MKILVTGATGYIGGRLVPRLLERGFEVRVLVRDAARIQGMPWASGVEVFQGDLLSRGTLAGACDGIDAAYYLVHSMYAGGDYAEHDRVAAESFCDAAADLKHVIYLGGLQPAGTHPTDPRTSHHLRSRAEIGRILASRVPTSEFRAGPIIGSGSASFELLRYATERLPVMFLPSWVHNEVQPIAVRDVLAYLVDALEQPPCGIVEIGAGPLTYLRLMRVYAGIRGLRRVLIPLPALLPAWLGAGWVGWVTPIPKRLAIPLIEGMAQPLVVSTSRARTLFPQIEPISYEQAVELALLRIRERAVPTRWSGALADASPYEYRDTEGMMREVRTRWVPTPPEAVFRAFCGVGGERGWFRWHWAWWIRGTIDRMLGGPGLRRGRRHPDVLNTGEAIDWWRVERIDEPSLLRLRAEIKLPGLAWLQWETAPEGEGTRLTQTAAFAPRGLGGALYWYALYPLHRMIFTDLIKGVARRAVVGEAHRDVIPGASHVPARPELGSPPIRTRGIFGDIRSFFAHKPALSTRIAFASQQEREDYSERILQRIGIDVAGYRVLNLHRIGIDVPVQYVFEELAAWGGDSSCWPNHIATAERVDDRIEHIRIRPFGLSRLPFFGGGRRRIPPLFDLSALRIRRTPGESDPDNARYLLYSSSGGYPIGVFLMYVRSSIVEQQEREMSQLFLGVGFNFYGRERWPLFHPINRIWESVHDRVTANVMNRIKQLSEWRFARTLAGG